MNTFIRYILKTEWIRVRRTNNKFPRSKMALFNDWRKRGPVQSVDKANRYL